MGLLDFISPQDEGQRQRNIAFFQQLAQAGAPSATPNSWALGLANGFGEGNKAQLAHQRFAGTQDLQKQEIDMNKMRMDAYRQEQERKNRFQKFRESLQGAQQPTQTAANFTNSALNAHFSGGDAFSPESIGMAAQRNAEVPASSGQPALSAWQRYQNLGDQLSAAGFDEEAKPYYDMAEKWKPKFKAETLRDAKTGRTVMLADDGSSLDTGMTAAEKAHFGDTGGRVIAFDPYTGKPIDGSGAAKTMTPGEHASNAVSWANYNLNKQNANKSQLVQTDQGFVWADPRSHQIVPAMGQDGMPIQPKLKDLPPAMQKTVMENTNSLRKIDRALELVDKYPNAFGLSNILGDTVRQRTDAEGVDGRAAVADIGSLVIHDRSGAAVTAAEYPRLAPFVPKATDSPETVKKKLQRFKSEYESVLSDVSSMYSKENGYRVPKMPEAPSNQQQLSRADKEASVHNARNAILRNPSQKAAIIQRLEQNGITNHGLR